MKPTVYITGGSKNPSGGTKVMNELTNLFIEKGFESYAVTSDDSGPASFLENPAPTLSINEYENGLKEDDITIDFWPTKRFFNISSRKKNKRRVFWQHGASIPIGNEFAGEDVFKKGNPYTHHWNVSSACADYIEYAYDLKNIDIVHPFFDTDIMKKFVAEKDKHSREGFLILARRGQKYIPKIIKKFGTTQKITVMKPPFHEKDFFAQLLTHEFYISVDDGIHNVILKNKIKTEIKKIVNKDFRIKENSRNNWIIPKGNLLGFPMPPVEASLLGTVVIGFAMGGGLEWMNDKNCFLAKDKNEKSLFENIEKAIQTPLPDLHITKEQSFKDIQKFTKTHTWDQITNSLSL